MACRWNRDASSFSKAAENLQRTAHLEVSKETLRELVESEGKVALRQMRKRRAIAGVVGEGVRRKSPLGP